MPHIGMHYKYDCAEWPREPKSGDLQVTYSPFTSPTGDPVTPPHPTPIWVVGSWGGCIQLEMYVIFLVVDLIL